MKIGDRKELKSIEVIFLIVLIGVMIFGINFYSDIFWKKSANLFERVKQNTMEHAKKLRPQIDLLNMNKGIIDKDELMGSEKDKESIKSPKIVLDTELDKNEDIENKGLRKRSNSFVDGIDSINRGDYNKAKEYLAQSAVEQKNDPESYFWLGVAHLNTDQATQAIKSFEQAIVLDPDNVEYMMNLSMAYFHAKDKQKSIKILEKALKIEPDNMIIKETME